MNWKKIRKIDKLPILPKNTKAIYILKDKDWTYIFCEGNGKRYTLTWDKISKNPNMIQVNQLTPIPPKNAFGY
jgi:hypothetical protein